MCHGDFSDMTLEGSLKFGVIMELSDRKLRRPLPEMAV